MINALPDPPLLVITDRATAAGPISDIVAAALRGGCRWVMLREKDGDADLLGQDLMVLCRAADARLIVNGDPGLALKLNAAGAHLQSASEVDRARAILGPGALIGVSCHSGDDIKAADEAGADYATLSPVFLTESKPGYGPALGLEALRRACAVTRLPVLALAGIDAGNATSCVAAGAAGIAMMGGVMRAAEPEAIVADLIRSLEPGSSKANSC